MQLSEPCTEGGEEEVGPQEDTSTEETLEEGSSHDKEEEVEEEEAEEVLHTPQAHLTRRSSQGSSLSEAVSPPAGRTRRLSDFRSCLLGEGLFRSSDDESYSIAGSDGSISTSVASIQPQPSTSSAPSSPGSRRSVSTLKKWFTNPVRKLSGGNKVERQVKKLEGRSKRGAEGRRRSADDGGHRSFDLGVLRKPDETLTAWQDPKGVGWKGHTISGGGGERLPDLTILSDLLQGGASEPYVKDSHLPYLAGDSTDPAPTEEPPANPYPPADTEEERTSALEKSMYVLMELTETEKLYVEDLAQIVEGYMATMNTKGIPDDMKGKDKIVFGNIHQIYDWHKDYFLGELEKCLQDPDRLAQLFIKHERRLHMYVVYCQNKPKSEHIVSEYIDTYFEDLRQQLGHRLQLNDLLIKPVQRIMKYQLLLKDFLKYYSKAGVDITQLEKAVEVMCFVPKRCNDMMNLGRLQGFEGKITAQGKLLQQDTFSVGEQDGGFLTRPKERRVFLFEQIIIFSEPIDKKKGFSLPGYIFKNSIKVSSLGLEECVDSDPCKFALTSRGVDRNIVRYVLQASSPEIRQAWVSDVNQILDVQRNFLNALQSPIEYQRRESKSNSLGRATNSHTVVAIGAGMRPHSSASMDRNKSPNLKSYNSSLPSLYLPSHQRQDSRQLGNENNSLQARGTKNIIIPSSSAPSPSHISLDCGEPPSTGSGRITNGVTQGDPARRKLSIGSRDFADSVRGFGGLSQDDACPPTARLAKLDEDEL
ncbi:rho guanine nucleotide exchange factor 25 isoform X2 [Ambystoma mexicanum]|uniref:rho guanine nucleotide exchange factor 25 isoform X2 n=1 Tax=Ambystoma mexicanum TaxID=8296 RepID=UPI0037E8CB8C